MAVNITVTAVVEGNPPETIIANTTNVRANGVDDTSLYDNFASILPTVYIMICLIGVVGNGLVILVTLTRAALKHVLTIYILNLAIADLLFMLTLPIMARSVASRTWTYGHMVCKFVRGFDGMNQFTGIFILTAMSVDRYIAVVHPMAGKRIRTLKRTKMINILLWTMSFLTSLPLWIFATVVDDGNERRSCLVEWPNMIISRVFVISAFVIGFACPILLIAACYFGLCLHLFRIQKSASRLPVAPYIRKGSRQLSILVSAIVVLFTMCWLPFYITTFIALTLPEGRPAFPFLVGYVFALFLSYVNSCLNPLIYWCLGARFRKSVKGLLVPTRSHRECKIKVSRL
uniref:Somatostatin receptor type 2-like n=1 Tax=Saccoglossus kowalevskii TaxID=10224 RepID=A0ABM0H0I1_SACKO|nr:PREDICTED: somatostatin receptor type 2-like [Saccoglossus kowalevskii]